jgi:peptidoglycan/LPS O-acetylase OafA/YrhL
MTDNKPGERRHDLDALRVMSFATLIIFHTSLLYDSNPALPGDLSARWFDLISVGSHPWRMSLLFVISGMVTASLLKKRSMVQIRSSRTRQLLLPFVFGVLFIVPPQAYLAHSDIFSELSYWQFWTTYIVSHLTIEHMWFLAYLWIYIFIWSLVFPPMKRLFPRIEPSFASCLQGAKLIIVPVLFLSATRIWLYPIFGETLIIRTDFYAHILYFSMFMAGALLLDEQLFWKEIDRQRWLSCGLAVIAFLAIALTVLALPRGQWPDELVVVIRFVRSIFQWCTIISLLAFGARMANRPNRVIAYLNSSIMTYYVIHQTVIVIVAYYLAQAGLLNSYSFVPIIVITAVACLLAAEMQKFVSFRYRLLISRIVVWRKAPRHPSSSEAAV